ncbi:MAG TPA: ROK family transcriptional regulator [Streptosporangiaceae bacterium]
MRSSTIPARAGHTDIRRNNLEVVLRHLWAVGPDSRAGIATRAGLTRATVSRLVAELISLGLVSETGLAAGRGLGRPGTELMLTGQHIVAIGAEINVDYLAVLAVDLSNREVYQERRAFDAQRAGAVGSIRALAELCGRCLQSLPARTAGRDRVIAGLGVAIPGLVDEAHAIVSCAPNLGWDDVMVLPAMGEDLARQVGTITIGNDANRAAIAEYRVGSHAGTPNLVYVTGEVGIGGGMIVQGKPLLGSRGYGGEVGHMTLDPDGPRCGCGRRGCWESFVGLNALLSATGTTLAAARSGPGPSGPGPNVPGPNGPGSPEDKIAFVVAGARAEDAQTLAALTELGRYVGIGAANIAKIVNPDVIVLGGYFTAIAEWILPAARDSLRAGLLAPDSAGCELTTSSLGFMAAARGAAIDILDRVISNPNQLLGRKQDAAG